MTEFKNMSTQDIISYIKKSADASEELIRRLGYERYWQALGYFFQIHETACEIGLLISESENNRELVMKRFEELWHESCMDGSGLSREEYFENPELPIWENPQWKYNEESCEWEQIKSNDVD